MRSEHTGIFERTIPETREDWFHVAILGSTNSVSTVMECAKRARETFRRVFNLPEDTSTKNGSAIVRLDTSRRPLTETQERDENRYVLEMLRLITRCDEDSLLHLNNLSRRDLRNNPVAADVRALLFAAEVFYLTWQNREALVRKQRELRPVELLRELTLLNENLLSMAMRIAELDKQIAVAPYEEIVRYGEERKQGLRRMRAALKKKKDAIKTLWKAELRRLDSKHPKWTIHGIAKEARDTPPRRLRRVALSTLQTWVKEIRSERARPTSKK
ncbi:MAG TPA: hypothetical protein VNH65_07985 [Candidatus Acidoferrum sp.]|nr:hypothetical protein [Candidatus Acidoferrum sp.]